MSNDKQTAAAERTPVRIWTDEEKDIVWEQTCLAKEKNLPLTEAFRRVAKILPHRSDAAVGMLYYNVLRKEREEPPAAEKKKGAPPAATEFKVDKRLLEAFQGLPEYIHDLNKKIKELEKRLQQPDPAAILTALGTLAARQTELDDYTARIESLQSENRALQVKNETLQEQLHRLKQAYDDALGIYDMFTNMASISQIMSLGDFKQQMKTTLDKWGNVLAVSFERVN